MHKNWLYLLFLFAITVTVILFCFDTGKKLIDYYSMQRVQEAKELKFSVLEEGEESFLLQASYSFDEGEKNYCGYQLFDKPRYLSRYAAEQAMGKMKEAKWQVFFSPKNPRVNSLTKSFPLKSSLYSITLLGLWAYFLFLGFYVTQFTPPKKGP